MLADIAIYIASFFAIWFGAGLIVSSVDKFSKKLRLSSFAVSFFVLGFLTSTPEFAVGLSSIAEKKPEIFVGNLIGGIPVIFLFIVPLLAIFGNGIKIRTEFTPIKIFFSFFVIMAPVLFVMDGTITTYEAITAIVLYGMLFFIIQKEKGLLDVKNSELLNIRSYSLLDILKVLGGFGIVFLSSQIIVSKTLYFADLLNLSIFLVSLLLLSIGTNLPELSLAIKSVVLGKKDIAFGNYIGAGASHAFLFGILTLMNQGDITVRNHLAFTFLILSVGLLAFFYFARSKNHISRKEGFLLLLFYIAFVAFEILS